MRAAWLNCILSSRRRRRRRPSYRCSKRSHRSVQTMPDQVEIAELSGALDDSSCQPATPRPGLPLGPPTRCQAVLGLLVPRPTLRGDEHNPLHRTHSRGTAGGAEEGVGARAGREAADSGGWSAAGSEGAARRAQDPIVQWANAITAGEGALTRGAAVADNIRFYQRGRVALACRCRFGPRDSAQPHWAIRLVFRRRERSSEGLHRRRGACSAREQRYAKPTWR